MAFESKKATRQGIIPWIDLYSESGCGKTMSSLLLARGIAGPDGKIMMLDSESGRGSLYADVIPGGYEVVNIEPPFSPARYLEAFAYMFAQKPAVVVGDSLSHEWEGIGGVTDMAMENEKSSGRAGLHNWKGPKMEHAKLVQFLLRSPVPVICCIRAKYKTRQIKGTPELAEQGAIRRDQIGKTVILKDEHTSPIQAEDFIYEATVHAEILHDHSIHLTKCSHPGLRTCFPETGPLTVEHGRAIKAWCSVEQGPGTNVAAASKPADPLRDLKKTLWKMLDGVVPAGEKDWNSREEWLKKNGILGEVETIKDITQGALVAVIEQVPKHLPK